MGTPGPGPPTRPPTEAEPPAGGGPHQALASLHRIWLHPPLPARSGGGPLEEQQLLPPVGPPSDPQHRHPQPIRRTRHPSPEELQRGATAGLWGHRVSHTRHPQSLQTPAAASWTRRLTRGFIRVPAKRPPLPSPGALRARCTQNTPRPTAHAGPGVRPGRGQEPTRHTSLLQNHLKTDRPPLEPRLTPRPESPAA